MKKNLIFIVTIVILLILLISFMPSITKGMRISKLQRELQDYKEEYARCEIVLSESHSGANAVREQLNGLVGLAQPVETGTTTPIQQMDKFISGQTMTGH